MKKGAEVATIDVVLVTLKTMGTNAQEIGLTTANQVGVAPATETSDAVKNIVKGVLIAQKPASTIVTGNTITLTDNVFNPDMVKILQGGTIYYWADATHTTKTTTKTAYGIAGYKPPVIGSKEKGEIFELCTYSAIYNAAGIITGYEKCVYPNCQGQPVALNVDDDTFRAPQYTIDSAPDTGEAPYEIEYVSALPEFETYSVTQTLTKPASGYSIGSVSVTMGGTNITTSAWDSTTNTVTISGVTGNVVITASAEE